MIQINTTQDKLEYVIESLRKANILDPVVFRRCDSESIFLRRDQSMAEKTKNLHDRYLNYEEYDQARRNVVDAENLRLATRLKLRNLFNDPANPLEMYLLLNSFGYKSINLSELEKIFKNKYELELFKEKYHLEIYNKAFSRATLSIVKNEDP